MLQTRRNLDCTTGGIEESNSCLQIGHVIAVASTAVRPIYLQFKVGLGGGVNWGNT